MSEEGAPGREFCEAISELARTGRFEQLRDVLPGLCTTSFGAAICRIPRPLWLDGAMLAQEMRQGFIQHARQRLTSLTRLQQAGDERIHARLAGDSAGA
jgi:hypothetical protein